MKYVDLFKRAAQIPMTGPSDALWSRIEGSITKDQNVLYFPKRHPWFSTAVAAVLVVGCSFVINDSMQQYALNNYLQTVGNTTYLYTQSLY